MEARCREGSNVAKCFALYLAYGHIHNLHVHVVGETQERTQRLGDRVLDPESVYDCDA